MQLSKRADLHRVQATLTVGDLKEEDKYIFDNVENFKSPDVQHKLIVYVGEAIASKYNLTLESITGSLLKVNSLACVLVAFYDAKPNWVEVDDTEYRNNVLSRTPNLKKYGKVLGLDSKTSTACKLKHRDADILRVVQALGRKTRSSVVVTGDSGVGKTALIEGLAYYMLNKNKLLPTWAHSKIIISLSSSLLISGTKYRGDFEERMQLCLAEAENCKDIILFFDNAQDLLGLGTSSASSEDSGLDGASFISNALKSNTISAIFAVTNANYVKAFSKKQDLISTTQRIALTEHTLEETVSILAATSIDLKKHYNISIPKSILTPAATLAKRYVTTNKLPSSAIDLLDEALSKTSMRNEKVLDEDTLTAVISEWSGIPIKRVRASEIEKLKSLDEALALRVKGQPEAIASVAKAIRTSRLGLSDATRPYASFLFAGSTGVGKTELCKALALELFGSEDAIIRIDMSEYMTSETVSKLVGSSKGYVGYSEGGVLTNAIIDKPYSIVLFDEIEKAHPQILNVLLQVLDDARLTDNSGRTVSFKDTVIIMTTNLGAKRGSENNSVGFVEKTDSDRKKEFMKTIKNSLAPEFINRIDDVVIFNRLNDDTLTEITLNMLNEVKKTVKEKHHFNVSFTESLINWVKTDGFDIEYGARPIRRFISKNIVTVLSNFILENSGTSDTNDTDLILDYVNGVCTCTEERILCTLS